MQPELRIHGAVRINRLNATLIWGVAKATKGEVLEVCASDRSVACSRRPLAPAEVAATGEQVFWYEDDFFVGFFDAAFSEVRLQLGAVDNSVTVSEPSWTTQLPVSFVQGELCTETIEDLRSKGLLQAIAVLALVEFCVNGLSSEVFSDQKNLGLIGESLRKSSLKVMSAEILFASTRGPSDQEINDKLVDLICDGWSYSDFTVEFCSNLIKENPVRYSPYLNIAHRHFGDGQLEVADAYYMTASRLLASNPDRSHHFSNGVLTWRDQRIARALQSTEARQLHDDLDIQTAQPGSYSSILLIGADAGYVKKYGNLLLNTAFHAGAEDICVHFHVANPDEETKAYLEAWHRRKDIYFGYSVAKHKNTSKPLYTCLRFLAAPQIMDLYALPVFITDIDVAIHTSWSQTIPKLLKYDLGFVYPSQEVNISKWYVRGWRPWDVAANTLFINNTHIGKDFLKFVKSYISGVLYFPSEERWWECWGIDQVAIRRALDVDSIPKGAKAINLGRVRFLKRPPMHLGGKEALFEGLNLKGPDEFTV